MSTPTWVHRYHLVVASADRAAADALAAALDPDVGGADTFRTPLRGAGLDPAADPPSHFGANAAATDAIRAALAAALADGAVPSIAFCRLDAATGTLADANVPAALASVGRPWGWADTLAALDLLPAPDPE